MREKINSLINDIEKVKTELSIMKIKVMQLSNEGINTIPKGKTPQKVAKIGLNEMLTKYGLPVDEKYMHEIKSIASEKGITGNELEKILKNVNDFKNKEIKRGHEIGSIEKITYKFMYNYNMN